MKRRTLLKQGIVVTPSLLVNPLSCFPLSLSKNVQARQRDILLDMLKETEASCDENELFDLSILQDIGLSAIRMGQKSWGYSILERLLNPWTQHPSGQNPWLLDRFSLTTMDFSRMKSLVSAVESAGFQRDVQRLKEKFRLVPVSVGNAALAAPLQAVMDQHSHVDRAVGLIVQEGWKGLGELKVVTEIYIEHGEWERAEAIINLIVNQVNLEGKDHTLADIARVYIRSGRPEMAIHLIRRLPISDDVLWVWALASQYRAQKGNLPEGLVCLNEAGKILRSLGSLSDEALKGRSLVLMNTLPAFIEACVYVGKTKWGIQLLQDLEGDVGTLAMYIAEGLAVAGDYGGTLRITCRTGPSVTFRSMCSYLQRGPSLYSADAFERAGRSLEDGKMRRFYRGFEELREIDCSTLAESSMRAGLFNEAIEVAKKIKDPISKQFSATRLSEGWLYANNILRYH